MKRTEIAQPAPAPDFSELRRCLLYLDEILKRPLIFGVEDDAVVVSTEDIEHALLKTNNIMAETTKQMDMLARSYARLSSLRLQ